MKKEEEEETNEKKKVTGVDTGRKCSKLTLATNEREARTYRGGGGGEGPTDHVAPDLSYGREKIQKEGAKINKWDGGEKQRRRRKMRPHEWLRGRRWRIRVPVED